MKIAPTHQKLRGGYYTPKPIADFLARWLIQAPDAEVLEPSCGDGMLLGAAISTLLKLGADKKAIAHQIQGVEINPEEAEKAEERMISLGVMPTDNTIYVGDFFTYCRNKIFAESLFDLITPDIRTFDAVIGNPPFIRYQNFPEEYRNKAMSIMKQAGFNPSKLMNTWLPFLITSSLLLKENGRLGMVIPAELFQVNYAAEVRRFLSDYYEKINLITFKKLVFEDIQQEVVLLLCDRNRTGNGGIRVIEYDDADDLALHLDTDFSVDELKPMDHSKEKWTQYYLSIDEILLLRKLRSNPDLTLSNKVLTTDVGVVTGENKFFILDQRQVQEADVKDFTQKIVSRSGNLKGAIFTTSDWEANANELAPSYLLSFPKLPFEDLPESVQKYIKYGETKQYHKGFKCRIRDPWYIVPSVWTPDAFMLRQIHGYPKIILNKSDATCTDTIHRIRFIGEADKETVTSAFMNVLTFAFAEVTGRSYGGGVLTFEPSETERLPLPLKNSHNLDLQKIDSLLREGDVKQVLAYTDEILLKQGLGLGDCEIKMLHCIWEKLRDRRINRKHQPNKQDA